ncbi:MAG: DUF3089 domain-containing protein [Bacteroidales bacterium]|jgi:hypothetical protein|nr:DUF3089 domain-containing protein [Bacteroidales bacterium]
MTYNFYHLPFGLIDLIPIIIPQKKNISVVNNRIDYTDDKSWFFIHKKIKLNDKGIDTFFVHRTTYLCKNEWNATINDNILNYMTKKYSIEPQKRIFDEFGRFFAPKYRQATLYSFYDESNNGKFALDLAYMDVKDSFDYYLNNYNNGRGIILVGHSQGTYHLCQIIKDFFDNDDYLRTKLVCAYIPSMPVKKDIFRSISPSNNYNDISCFVSWSSFGEGACPRYFKDKYKDSFCINPVTWESVNSKQSIVHLGAKSYYFNIYRKLNINIYINNGFLNISNPGIGFPFLKFKDYVMVDFHLFHFNIKQNVGERIKHFKEINNEK